MERWRSGNTGEREAIGVRINWQEMKSYDFARLQARAFPTPAEARNPYIYGRVGVVVNVSGREHPGELRREFDRMGVRCHHLPLVETGPDMGLENILLAVGILEEADAAGIPAVVHCDFGNNRSRVVAEAFCLLKTGILLDDEYRGARNHLVFNCLAGHLPPVPEMVSLILSPWPDMHDSSTRAV